MQIRATIIKLLLAYQPPDLLSHIANEMEQQAAHYETVGAPKKAAYLIRQVEVLRDAVYSLDALKY